MAGIKHPDLSTAISPFCYLQRRGTWRLAGSICFAFYGTPAVSYPSVLALAITFSFSFLQIDFMYYVNTDLLTAFHCDRPVSQRYCGITWLLVQICSLLIFIFSQLGNIAVITMSRTGINTSFFEQQLQTYRAVSSKTTEEAN